MNKTIDKLRQEYVIRFGATAVCVAVASASAHLIVLGKTGGNFVAAVGVALVCGIAGWKGSGLLAARWKQLRQLDVLQEHGPYDTRAHVNPDDVSRQVGGADRNMWG